MSFLSQLDVTLISEEPHAINNPTRLYANVVNLFADHVNIHTITNKADPHSLFSYVL
jgi:hypothetical protein